MHFVNTNHFREAALHFKKHGRYTLAPIGSKDWWEYWEEQERRCLYGYKVGDIKITGRHYFYLNFFPIDRVLNPGAKVERKVSDFPAFWEIDYNWWWYKEIAWYGCDKEFLNKLKLTKNPIRLDGGFHLSCLKTRRAGFSYKEGCDGVYNYTFIDGSKSYYFAAAAPFLDEDGILNKVEDGLNHLNQNTDGFFKKNRMKKNTLYHHRASYIDDQGEERGTFSEIFGRIVDNPNKARGKDALKITFEESGSFKNLKAALQICFPSLKDGGVMTGQASVFGTGGEEGEDIEGLEEVFEDPITWDMLPFENDWEEGYFGTECGVFIPCYMANMSVMDKEGNVNTEEGLILEDAEREKKKRSKDPKALDKRIAEYPKVPTEALQRISLNLFPVAEARAQKNRILRSKSIQGSIQYGELVRESGGLRFKIKTKDEAGPLDFYPHKQKDDLSGCVTIFERPFKINGEVPDDLYAIVVDPFYNDNAEDKTSLGAVYVMKVKSNITPFSEEQIVASYIARPLSLSTFYETIFKLADYYNCKIQSEISGGGKGIIDWARENKRLDKLMYRPVYINNKETQSVSHNRDYFLNTSTDDVNLGLTYFADWLKKCIGYTEDGEEIWNIHYIFDLGLLEEIIKYHPKKNADRISAQIVARYTLKELRFEEEHQRRQEDKDNSDRKIFNGSRRLFTNTPGRQTSYQGNLIRFTKDGQML